MLDYKRIGKLITIERQKINLTQEQLSEELFVTRQAISKWERGQCMPDYDSLICLSKIFSISLNELVAGERLGISNRHKINTIFISLLKEKEQKRIIITILFTLFLFLSLFSFFLYYFISTYNKFHVYKFYGESENYSITNMLGIFSNENAYLKLNILETVQTFDVIEIYYLKDNGKQIVCKTKEENILLTEFNNYQEYFTYKNRNDFIHNLYLDIYKGENIETIKLNVQELYANTHLFFKEEHGAQINVSKQEKNPIPSKIQKEFLKDTENRYFLESPSGKLLYEADLQIFLLEKQENQTTERWIYNILFQTIFYQKYEETILIESSELQNNNTKCQISNCIDHEEKYNYFLGNYVKKYFE